MYCGVYLSGSDGWVRTWDFDTVDQAEASEELNGKYALDPMNELQFAPGSKLVSMWPHPDPEQESIWFMQVSTLPSLLTWLKHKEKLTLYSHKT